MNQGKEKSSNSKPNFKKPWFRSFTFHSINSSSIKIIMNILWILLLFFIWWEWFYLKVNCLMETKRNTKIRSPLNHTTQFNNKPKIAARFSATQIKWVNEILSTVIAGLAKWKVLEIKCEFSKARPSVCKNARTVRSTCLTFCQKINTYVTLQKLSLSLTPLLLPPHSFQQFSSINVTQHHAFTSSEYRY